MEEYIWYLVEKFIAGQANEAEQNELAYLLGVNQPIFDAVSEFLETYRDPDPQITSLQKQALLKRAGQISRQLAYFNQTSAGNTGRMAINGHHLQLGTKSRYTRAFDGLVREARMVGQLFKMTLRYLQQNKSVSFINITGLAIGMASAVLIFLWVADQLSYDQFQKNKDRIYQVFTRATVNGEKQAWGSTPALLGPDLKAEYPQVEEFARVTWVRAFVLKYKDKNLQTQGLITDPGFLKMFSYPLLRGNATTALSRPHTIVLTHQMAVRLFGDKDPMGRVIRIDSNVNFTVTGVLKDLPLNTTFSFEYLVPHSYKKEVGWDRPTWEDNTVGTYVLLRPGTSPQKADELFKNVYRRHHAQAGNELITHQMTRWWLYSQYRNGKFVAGQLVVVQLFTIIAVLIMLIACINYMNLGTARSAKRAREVGIRKVAGAGRSMLVKQFLGESVLTSFIAGILALLLVKISLPAFNTLVENHLDIPFGNLKFWLVGLAFILFTGLIAGIYPAFYLSAYRPVKALKGVLKSTGALVAPRKVLVVVQFTLAIAFIICTVVIYRQINFVQNRDTGFNKQNLAYLYMKGDMQKNFTRIRDELATSGAITSITRTNSPVHDLWTGSDQYQWPGKTPGLSISISENLADKDFTKTMGLPLLSGRDLNVYQYPTDTAAVLLTKTAVKTMGFKEPLGQIIRIGHKNLHVVGTIKDFVAGWPYQLPQPIIIKGATQPFGTVSMKLNSHQANADNINKISQIIRKYNPDYPFDLRFVEDYYTYGFTEEQHTGAFSALFAGLAIFISCLGLFALAAFMAESRRKEIGIRKVLGATVAGLTALISKDFLVLVVLSFAIASPIAWVLMSNWLSSYPYHIHISWWIFGLTGLISVIIALLTVSYQAIKAAIANPVKSLRSE